MERRDGNRVRPHCKAGKLLAALLFTMLVCMMFVQTVFAAGYNISQANVSKPKVTVYYTVPEGVQDQLAGATLAGEELVIEEDQSFAQTGEPVEYYFLLDISKSVAEDDFRRVQDELVSFRQTLRDGDRLILYTFGDEAQTTVLDGSETPEDAEQKIRQIERASMQTYLVQAILKTVEQIQQANAADAASGAAGVRRILTVASDGFDDADSTVGRYSAVATLQSAGVPVYTLAVNASLQRSEEEKKAARAELNDIANSTNAIPWSVDMDTSMNDAFQIIQADVLGGSKAVLRASSNRVSNNSEQLELKFASGQKASRSVTVAGYIPDDTPLTATVSDSGSGRIRIDYNKSTQGAANTNNYQIRHNGKNLAVIRVQELTTNPSSVELIFENDKLENGAYDVIITGVKDISQEEHALQTDGQAQQVEITTGNETEAKDETAPSVTAQRVDESGQGFVIVYSEPVDGAQSNGSYRVTLDGAVQAVTQATRMSGESDFAILLLMAKPPVPGEYTIEISGVTDKSGNALENPTVTVSVSDTAAPSVVSVTQYENSGFLIAFSEEVQGAEEPANYELTSGEETVAIESVEPAQGQENTYLITPAVPLADGSYALSVKNITDYAGNPVDSAEPTAVEVKLSDTQAPTVTSVEESAGQDGFVITFSEPVENASSNGNYKVTYDKKTIAVQQAIYDDAKNAVTILLDGGLKNGSYEILIKGIRDAAGNVIETKTYTPDPIEDIAEEIETETEENPSIPDLILKWWPIVLTVIVLILILLFVLFLRRIQKGKVVRNEQTGELMEVGVDGVPDQEGQLHIKQDNAQPPQPQQMITLWLSNGRDEPQCIQQNINGSLIVGRSSKECDIYCDDPRMSKQHFMLSVEGDGLYVTDLNSTNGTSVNGVALIGQRRLMPRDEISAGNIRFKIEW